MPHERDEWCGCNSGLKYEVCRLQHENTPQSDAYRIAKKQQTFFQRKVCSHPEASAGGCGGPIIRAHTVRRAADLKNVAKKGHVYSFTVWFGDLVRSQGKPIAKRIGINDASTFTGFCQLHDASTFRPLEALEYNGSAEQNFLLFYRSWSRETYAKHSGALSIPNLRKLVLGRKAAERQSMYEFLDSMELGLKLGVRDADFYKGVLDNELVSKNYSAVESVVIELAGATELVAAGCVYPTYDFHGNHLQELGTLLRPEPLSISVLASSSGSFVVLSWLRGHASAPRQLVQSLLQQPGNIPDGIVRLIYSSIENAFAAPDWWEGLSKAASEKILSCTAHILCCPFPQPR
jgi:hypothetical protein